MSFPDDRAVNEPMRYMGICGGSGGGWQLDFSGVNALRSAKPSRARWPSLIKLADGMPIFNDGEAAEWMREKSGLPLADCLLVIKEVAESW